MNFELKCHFSKYYFIRRQYFYLIDYFSLTRKKYRFLQLSTASYYCPLGYMDL